MAGLDPVRMNVMDAIKRLEKEYSGLASSKFNAAVSTALNKVAAQAKTAAASKISKAYKIKSGDAKKTLSLGNSTGKTLRATLSSSNKRIPALAFMSGSWSAGKGKGVYVNIKGQRKRIADTFITTMNNGHKGIFVRTQKGGAYAGGDLRRRHQRIEPWRKHDLAIGEVLSISMARAAVNPVVIQAMADKTREKFGDLLLHELQRKSGQIAGART